MRGAALSAEALRTLTLPKDRSGFVRRECSSCRRHFKSRPALQDGLAVQGWLDRHVQHAQLDGEQELDHSRCPYCAQPGAAEQWLTRDQRGRIDRLGERLQGHLQHTLLVQAGFALGFATRPTFLPVSPDPLPLTLGTEPDDMRTVLLVCCDLDIKVQPDWDGVLHCPACGTVHGRPAFRQQMHLSFVEE